jgi:hypothetical protein
LARLLVALRRLLLPRAFLRLQWPGRLHYLLGLLTLLLAREITQVKLRAYNYWLITMPSWPKPFVLRQIGYNESTIMAADKRGRYLEWLTGV